MRPFSYTVRQPAMRQFKWYNWCLKNPDQSARVTRQSSPNLPWKFFSRKLGITPGTFVASKQLYACAYLILASCLYFILASCLSLILAASLYQLRIVRLKTNLYRGNGKEWIESQEGFG